MNPTTDKLQAEYAVRFAITAAALVSAAVAARLVWLGETGGHFYLAVGVAVGGGYAGCLGLRMLYGRYRQLRQFEVLQQNGPYGRREYVPPQDAARQVGDSDGPNMWRV